MSDEWFVRHACQRVLERLVTLLYRLSRDVKNESSLLYTRQRDIHSVGIVLLQMLMGLGVTENFSNVHTALQSCK